MTTGVLNSKQSLLNRSQVRSEMCGLERGVRPDIPYRPKLNQASLFARAAEPVLLRLSESLSGIDTSVVLLDRSGLVLRTEVDDSFLRKRMEKGMSAPGFLWAEEYSGTSAVGIALEERVPMLTTGQEHYLELLYDLSCAAAPISNPFSSKFEGIIDITSFAVGGNPLMLSLVKQSAKEIERQMFEMGSSSEKILLSRFLAERKRSDRIVLVHGDRVDLSTSNAAEMLNASDRTVLKRISEDVAEGKSFATRIQLHDETSVTVQLEAVVQDGRKIGTVIQLVPDTHSVSASRRAKRTLPKPLSHEAFVGRSELAQSIRAAAEELEDSQVPVIVAGPSGTGKMTAAHLIAGANAPVLSTARYSGNEAALFDELSRLVAAKTENLIVKDVSQLTTGGMQRLSSLSVEAEEQGTRLVCTFVEEQVVPTAQPPFGIRFQLSALRERPEDIMDLVPSLLERKGIRSKFSQSAMQALMRYEWPGNVRELDAVVTSLARAKRFGEIDISDIPVHYQRSGRKLSKMEAIERNAIIEALRAAHGNKTRAANLLEIGRATLYRKMSVYDIEH